VSSKHQKIKQKYQNSKYTKTAQPFSLPSKLLLLKASSASLAGGWLQRGHSSTAKFANQSARLRSRFRKIKKQPFRRPGRFWKILASQALSPQKSDFRGS
jgi:hypothetical protein